MSFPNTLFIRRTLKGREFPHNRSDRRGSRKKLHRNGEMTPISRLEPVRRVLFDEWAHDAVAEGCGVSARTVAKMAAPVPPRGAAPW